MRKQRFASGGYVIAQGPKIRAIQEEWTRPSALRAALAILAAVSLSGCAVLAGVLDRSINRVDPALEGVRPAPADAAAHQRYFVADLHADTLMWNRDMVRGTDIGHVDLPRLRAGNVSLQVFTAVTYYPPPHILQEGEVKHCFKYGDLNAVALLNAFQMRPPETWIDAEARALYQAELLRRAEAESQHDGATPVRIVRSIEDLEAVTRAWRLASPIVGAAQGIEGVDWLGDVATPAEAQAGLRRLYDAGFRVVLLGHSYDNGLAGSSEGCSGYGLTPLGRAVIAEAERLGMIVDLAHLSPTALHEAVDLAKAPFIVSHTGARGSCQPPCYPPRTLSDSDIQAVAGKGGIIGVGYWPAAVGEGLDSTVRTMAYIASVLSRRDFVEERRRRDPGYDPFDHIALGSDFDGFVTTSIDTSQLALLTGALRRYSGADGIHFTDERIGKIAGGNVCRVFATRLPGGSPLAPASICRGMSH
jgi:membrane dipeptidase